MRFFRQISFVTELDTCSSSTSPKNKQKKSKSFNKLRGLLDPKKRENQLFETCHLSSCLLNSEPIFYTKSVIRFPLDVVSNLSFTSFLATKIKVKTKSDRHTNKGIDNKHWILSDFLLFLEKTRQVQRLKITKNVS